MPSTKDKIIQLGDELMRMRGYSAFSYADIAKQLGVKNAAIHYHFPSKSDLAEAIVEWHVQNFESFTEKAAHRDPLSRLKMFMNFYSSIQISGKLCVIGAFASDWNSMEDSIQHKMQDFTDQVVSWISDTLDEGQNTGTFNYKGSTKTTALKILTNLFAATQLARITNSSDFNDVKNSIIEDLK